MENGSKNGAEAIVSEFSATLRARYVHVPAASKSAALNCAIEQLDDELIVFLDDDVRVSPGLLTAYASAARKLGRKSYFGGPFEVDYEQPPLPHVQRFLPRSARGWPPRRRPPGCQ